MTKRQTPHAACAAAIRAELKKEFPGLKFTCTSESFSMGNAVRVRYTDQPREVHEKIRALLAKYQYGHFDGMTDCYEYTNGRDDIPQIKWLTITNDMSDAKKEEIYQQLRTTWAGGDDLPETYQQGSNEILDGEYVSQMVWRVFTGALVLPKPREGHFMDDVIAVKEASGCDWSEALARCNVD